MSLRGALRRLERAYQGKMITIPQPGGIARFSEKDLAAAYLCATDRELGRTTEDHPLCRAARNSPDPRWGNSVYAGPEEVPAEVPDLSEP